MITPSACSPSARVCYLLVPCQHTLASGPCFHADQLPPAEAISYGYETGTDRLLSAVHPDGLELDTTYEDDGSVLSLVRDEPGLPGT